MADEVQEPKFEIVDDRAGPRVSGRKPARVVVVRGWKAALIAAPVAALAVALLLTVGAILAAAMLVAGALVGAGWLARKILTGGGSPKKPLGGDSQKLSRR